MHIDQTKPGKAVSRRVSGLTLVECMIAMVVLAIAVLGLSYVATAGHQHLKQGEDASRAIRLAEHLMEEIASRPYENGGVSRAQWGVPEYEGYEESAGNLRDFSGVLYQSQDQRFTRSVHMTHASVTVVELGNLTLPGKQVTVTAGLSPTQQWSLTRFIPEPVSP